MNWKLYEEFQDLIGFTDNVDKVKVEVTSSVKITVNDIEVYGHTYNQARYDDSWNDVDYYMDQLLKEFDYDDFVICFGIHTKIVFEAINYQGMHGSKHVKVIAKLTKLYG
jgi:hypothetical protein